VHTGKRIYLHMRVFVLLSKYLDPGVLIPLLMAIRRRSVVMFDVWGILCVGLQEMRGIMLPLIERLPVRPPHI
jgi:hypothetical protein